MCPLHTMPSILDLPPSSPLEGAAGAPVSTATAAPPFSSPVSPADLKSNDSH